MTRFRRTTVKNEETAISNDSLSNHGSACRQRFVSFLWQGRFPCISLARMIEIDHLRTKPHNRFTYDLLFALGVLLRFALFENEHLLVLTLLQLQLLEIGHLLTLTFLFLRTNDVFHGFFIDDEQRILPVVLAAFSADALILAVGRVSVAR